MKRKTLLTSILAIVMCLALATGATFALFTSQDKVDIAVSSGTVKVTATVENFEYKTLNNDWTAVVNNETAFDGIGGSAVLNGNELTLDKIVPGDGVRFGVKVTNTSDVTIKYRAAVRNLSTDNVLFDALNVSVNDEDFTTAKISDWEIITPAVDNVEMINLVIELPSTAEGEELMNKTAKLQIAIEAIQGNAETTNDTPVTTYTEFMAAMNAPVASGEQKVITLQNDFEFEAPVNVQGDVVIRGNGNTVEREEGYTDVIFNVTAGSNLALEDVVIDGGAIWEDPTASASTMSLKTYNVANTYGVKDKVNNGGVVATGALVATQGNAVLVLGEDTVLANNDGANAISLAMRGGGKLIINGAKIINNRSAAGAIWGGESIEFNYGEISGNHATSIGGAIRFVGSFGTFVMNGGKMNYNTSDGAGGAIYSYGGTKDWSFNNTKAEFIFNGGEVAYNSAATMGGVIHCHNQWNKIVVSGDVEIHDNHSGQLGAVIRFHEHTMFIMDGGKVYNNVSDDNGGAFYGYNVSCSLLGGEIYNDIGSDIDFEIVSTGGLGQVYGATKLDRPILLSVAQNVPSVALAEGFNFSFKLLDTVDANTEYLFIPYEGYVYTAGDEDRIVCVNDGVIVEWDETENVFKAHLA